MYYGMFVCVYYIIKEKRESTQSECEMLDLMNTRKEQACISMIAHQRCTIAVELILCNVNNYVDDVWIQLGKLKLSIGLEDNSKENQFTVRKGMKKMQPCEKKMNELLGPTGTTW